MKADTWVKWILVKFEFAASMKHYHVKLKLGVHSAIAVSMINDERGVS